MKMFYGTFQKHTLRANMIQPIVAAHAGEASELMESYHGKHYNVVFGEEQFKKIEESHFSNHKHYEPIMSSVGVKI